MGYIYQIFNTQTGTSYIGQTIHLRQRFNDHKSYLSRNGHPNKHLQSAWNKDSEESFIFRIIGSYNKEDLLVAEQYWYNYFKSIGPIYNYVFPYAISNLGKTFSDRKTYRHTAESKRKISASKKGNSKPNSGSFQSGHSLSVESENKRRIAIAIGKKGVTFTAEHKANLSKARKAYLNRTTVDPAEG